MASVGSQRQIVDPAHSRQGERPVKVGKQRTAARGFPLQRRAEGFGVDGQQDQPILAGAVLGGRGLDLGGGGKVDETVGPVLGGARIAPAGLRFGPLVLAADMEDHFVLHGRQGSCTTAA